MEEGRAHRIRFSAEYPQGLEFVLLLSPECL